MKTAAINMSGYSCYLWWPSYVTILCLERIWPSEGRGWEIFPLPTYITMATVFGMELLLGEAMKTMYCTKN